MQKFYMKNLSFIGKRSEIILLTIGTYWLRECTPEHLIKWRFEDFSDFGCPFLRGRYRYLLKTPEGLSLSLACTVHYNLSTIFV